MLGVLLAISVGVGVAGHGEGHDSPRADQAAAPTPPSSPFFYDTAPEPEVPTAPPTTEPPAEVPAHAAGPRSDAWWNAIALCESGDTNGWRTGYYGIEADHPIGDLSRAEQLAWAEQIYANYSDSAWGCSPVAWQQVPGG